MIERLNITNFQCHQSLSLDLCPGVNVIAGTSDVGKSAVLKALLWLITNKPQGLGFRNWDCGKGDVVTVEARLTSGDTVARSRSEGVNEYRLNDRPFVAMKSDVPLDIAEVLNMQPVNMQTQFMPHYLISTSSGEVARTLNDACDLSIIDATLKGINGVVSTAKSSAKAAQEVVDGLQEVLDSLEWVPDAEARLAKIEAEAAEADSRSTRTGELQSLLKELEALEPNIARITALLDLYAPIPEITNLVSGIEEKERQIQNLAEILEGVGTTDQRIAAIHLLDAKAVKKAVDALTEFQDTEARSKSLSSFLQEWEDMDDALCAAHHDHAMSSDALAQAWAEVDACPLCGAIVEESHAD